MISRFTTCPNAVAVVEPETAFSVAVREGNGKCGAKNEALLVKSAMQRRRGGEKVTGTTAYQFESRQGREALSGNAAALCKLVNIRAWFRNRIKAGTSFAAFARFKTT